MKNKILFLVVIFFIIFLFISCENGIAKKQEPVIHTVTFYFDNYTVYTTYNVEDGNLCSLPLNPINSNYYFDGWYTSVIYDNLYDFSIPVTSDISLFAKWDSMKKDLSVSSNEILFTFENLNPKYEYNVEITDTNPDLLIIKKAFVVNRIFVNLNLSKCSDLTTLIVDNNPVFKSTSFLKSIILPDSITVIDSDCFRECSDLESVTFNKIITISSYAFDSCKKLISISFPTTLKEIGTQAFYLCKIENIVFPPNLEIVGDRAFMNCKNLKNIDFQSKKVQLGRNAFYWSEGIRTIKIPEGISEIPYAFITGCEALTTIYLPKSINKIGEAAFEDTSLSKVYYAGSKYDWFDIEMELNNTYFDSVEFFYNYTE